MFFHTLWMEFDTGLHPGKAGVRVWYGWAQMTRRIPGSGYGRKDTQNSSQIFTKSLNFH